MDVHNTVSGTVAGNVIQGRDVTVALPATAPVAISGLPAQPLFAGRDTELALLANVLNPAEPEAAGRTIVISAIAGLAGVGKTAVAVRAAHDAAAAGWFPGGVLMVDLRGYDPPERRVPPMAALASLLGALGTPNEYIPIDQADRERLWRSLLAYRDTAGQRMLIVLDNASAAEQVHALLPGTGGHRVLITSRHSLADLPGARLLDVNVLSTEEAVELLQQALTAAYPNDNRVDADPRAAERLAQLCGGLPLAVRIAAALLVADPEQAIAELAVVLSDEYERLEELNYDGSLSVRAAFDLSYQHLAGGPARLLRLLALNPGPEVGIDAASALANLSAIQTRRMISQLRRAHLLQPGTVRNRWRMHDLLRLYAAECATKHDDREPALERLLRFYVTTSQAANQHIEAPAAARGSGHLFATRQDALGWLDTEYPNLVSAAAFAYDTGHYSDTIAMADALDEYFHLRLHLYDRVATDELAVQAARQLDSRSDESRMLLHLASALSYVGRNEEAALECVQQAVRMYQDLGDRLGEGNATHSLGARYRRLSRHDQAMRCHQRALQIYQELGERHGQAAALNSIGVRCADVGEWSQAEAHYKEALQIYRELGDRDAEAGQMGNLGNLYNDARMWEEALRCHRKALEIWQEFDNRPGQAFQLGNLGTTYRDMGRLKEAITCQQNAVNMLRECRYRPGEATNLQALGMIYVKAARPDQAIICYEESIQIYQDLGYAEDEAKALADLGDICHESGQLGMAVARWTKALNLYVKLDSEHPQASQLKAVLAKAKTNT